MEKNTYSYTKQGKLLKGFLCLVSFGIFAACLMMLIYGWSFYGESIITDAKSDYYESQSYLDQVLNRIYNATGHLLYSPSDMIKKNQFSVIDVEQKELYTYDLEDMYNYFAGELEYQDSLSGYNSFRKSYENINSMDLSDYKKARAFLEDKKYQDAYIYFNDVSFRALFLDQGIRNIDHRFSDDFEENACFIFDFQGKNKAAEKTLEKIRTCDREESIGEKYDLTDIDYAVYNDGVYYSTGDDYFEEYGCYVYKVQEINELLKELDPDCTRFDSILFGLLKSYNLSYEWIDEPYYAYDMVRSSKNTLDDMFDLETTGDFYFLSVDGTVKCSEQELVENISETSSILNMLRQVEVYLTDNDCIYHAFILPKAEEKSYETNGVPFRYESRVAEEFESYDLQGDVLFVYGFYNGDNTLPQQGISKYAKEYEFFEKNIRYFISFGILALLLTVFLAVSLICTTGRRYKGDSALALNFYDRMYGELWWLFTLAIVGFIGGAEFEIINDTIREPTVNTLIIFTTACVIFAFFVMIFVLSLCRRIKGRLVFKHILCVKVIQKLWRGAKNGVMAVKNDTLTHVKGTSRLILIYLVFAIANLLLIWICYDFSSAEMILVSLCLQVLGLFGMIFLVRDTNRLIGGVAEIVKGNLDYKVHTDEKFGIYKELTNNVNHIGDGLKAAVETSLKDERMKTELITNVSHDLKTPLTSIINYIELLKKEEMASDDAKHYVEVIDGKAQRLKHLTEDLVEAAKATSGNVELHMMPIDFNELMGQAIGEYEEKFAKKELEVVANYPSESIKIMADGRRLYRVLENVLQNVCKYAMPKTRVYIDLVKNQEKAVFTVKNVSDAPLNISPEELMERFTRGDESRTTEGSGLGLSIAKGLTTLQGGTFNIVLDGDLFKVVIEFSVVTQDE